MFLIPSKSTPPALADRRDEIFNFGDPVKLRDGVTLTEKGKSEPTLIHSLFDMELNVKYITEQGTTVKRISGRQVLIKKKPGSQSVSNLNVRQSQPINIPESTSSGSMRMPIVFGSLGRRSYTSDSSRETATPESDGSFDRHNPQMMSTTPSDEADFINKLKTSPFFHIHPSWHGTDGKNAMDLHFKSNPKITVVADIVTPHIPGERIEKVVEDVILMKGVSKGINGVLYLTNFQLIFLPYKQMSEDDAEAFKEQFVMLPLASIARFEKVDRQNNHFLFGGENSYSIDIIAKDFRKIMRFALDPGKHIRREICNHLSQCIYPNLSNVFAIASKQLNDGPWSVYDPLVEFKRMGVTVEDFRGISGNGNGNGITSNSHWSCGWKFTDQNADYSLCDSYPKILVVPEGLTSEDLLNVAGFRSKGRIPVLAWRSKQTGVSLTRCSQPKTGMSRTFRCKSDEKLVRLIQQTNPSSKKLHIIDARPLANAMANMALGGGYENISFYTDCGLEFMNIANIHAVRDSWNKLRDLCESYSQSTEVEAINYHDATNHNDTKDYPSSFGSSGSAITTFGSSGSSIANYQSLSKEGVMPSLSTKVGSNWLSQLERTGWLDNLSTVLCASLRVVQLMHLKRESVFLHCSDGWDRTPQVCSLAQILLDKYYRTVQGFCVLIEKEWICFGHKFAERLGLLLSDDTLSVTYKDNNERAPIFLQFLDAVWQILQQFPHAFEFSEDLLITIMDHAYSARFGNFLFNASKEREEAKLSELSPSLWTFIRNNIQDYMNPFYVEDREPSVLYPQPDVKNLRLWNRYYMRYFTDNLSQYEDKYLLLGKEMRGILNATEEKLKLEKAARKAADEELQQLRLFVQTLKTENQQPTTAASESPHSEQNAANVGNGDGTEKSTSVQAEKKKNLEDSDWEQL